MSRPVRRAPIARRVVGLIAALAAGFLPNACGDAPNEAAPGTEPVVAVGLPAELECETTGFPCAWADVPAQIDSLSRTVASDATRRIGTGEPWRTVAEDLAARDDLAEVLIGDEAIRFRVEGGRPEWIFAGTDPLTLSGAAVPPGSSAALSAEPSGGAASHAAVRPLLLDPVGSKPIRTKPTKRALVLSMFAWQWDVHGLDDESDDRVADIVALFEASRDYGAGKIEFKSNELAGTGQTRRIAYGAGLDDYRGWDAYDVIHVSTHGGNVCRRFVVGGAGAGATTGGEERPAESDYSGSISLEDIPCQTTLATATLWDGVVPTGGEKAGFTTTRGVSRGWIPVTRKDAAEVADLLGASKSTASAGPFVGVSTDFFRAEYPSGLSEALVFLNACSSGKNSALVDHLSSGGSTAIGWETNMQVQVAGQAALCIWQSFLGPGKKRTATDALCDIAIARAFDLDPGEHEGGIAAEDVAEVIEQTFVHMNRQRDEGTPVVSEDGITMSAGGGQEGGDRPEAADGEDAAGGARGAFAGARVGPTGDLRNRAIEIVRLVEAGSEREFEDGDLVRLAGASGDGVPDTLLAEIEVFGIGPSDEIEEMELQLAVDGARQSVTLTPERYVEKDRFRSTARLPLDVDLPKGETLDLDVVAEYPDGRSRWLYEDLRYDVAWTADVGIGPYAGHYTGQTASAWWGARGLERLHLGGVGAGPAPHVYIDFYVDDLEYRKPGSYTPPRNRVEINFSRTPAIADVQAEFYTTTHGGPPPRNVIEQTLPGGPDPLVTSPITLVFEELSGSRVRGRLTGPFYHLEHRPQNNHHPGSHGTQQGSVSITFDVVPCSPGKKRAGAC